MRNIILVILFLLIPVGVAHARIGVGVGTGKIVVDEKLKPGIIYNLPPLTVVNTGDEPSEYQVSATYHENQPEFRPKESWFIFTPKKFHLEPSKVQVVNIKLNLPLNVEPGKYFAYLEGHPLKKSESGTTSIGIAAAAKLYFEVVPANLFQAIYYKIVSIWNIYQPWTTWVAIALGVIVLLALAKNFLHIQINLKGKAAHPKENNKKDE